MKIYNSDAVAAGSELIPETILIALSHVADGNLEDFSRIPQRQHKRENKSRNWESRDF